MSMVREDIVRYFDKLREVETEGVEPMVQSLENRDVERDDVVTTSDIRDGLLAGAPEMKDEMFVVPRSI